ncbi:MAG: RidA family protein [Nocardiopsis sp. BM-2018]|uniref:Enamine deaminase RidA (YjgF/YER057c/UK114 family) n=1 Tax=Nocardiopsis metallicus TaxID=179819 RepID=A0A840W9R6_9ACTN|nr:RidA family protein [Nocardiopsis metallicus]MBB5492123.1 enamine deaminase RidA (YjgF/YER057c/UK114 family) [Nocardiopsis metallicus]QRN81606.1 MAG: RidA family protein [Nocardiopsis sp. BM-2018]
MEPADLPPSPHTLVNPPELGPTPGFSHAVVPAPGRAVHLAGQIASGPGGTLVARDLPDQFGVALDNVVTALRACGGAPEHLVSLTIYTTDVPGYRSAAREIGRAYRARLGRHYPAMALLGVTDLFEPGALVELVGAAVIPDSGPGGTSA